jgi:hypothetical protein
MPVATTCLRRLAPFGLLPDLCSKGVRPGHTLTDGAGGFLLGVPLGGLGMGGQDHIWGPGPL